MLKKITPLLLNHHTTKVSAIIVGYFLWFAIAQYQLITTTIEVPICFYNAEHTTIHAPDSITMVVQATQKNLYRNKNHIALHIDASILRNGTQEIMLEKQNLFLPDTIKLIDLIPSCISIEVSSKNR